MGNNAVLPYMDIDQRLLLPVRFNEFPVSIQQITERLVPQETVLLVLFPSNLKINCFPRDRPLLFHGVAET